MMTIGIMLLSSVFAFMFSNFYYQQKLKPENDAKNTKIALEIATYMESIEPSMIPQYLENIAAIGYQLMWVPHKNKREFFGDPFRDKNLPQVTEEKVLNGEIYHGMLHFPQETFVTGFFANELTNTIGVPIHIAGKNQALFLQPNIKLLFHEMHYLFTWILLLTVILSILFVLLSTKLLIQPIERLTEATKELSEGKFSINLAIERKDEIGKLAQHFTTMAKKLEKLDEMKSEFIENASHDIQTPLATMKGYIKLLQRNNLSCKERKKYLAILKREMKRLSNLTKQLLLLASIDRNDPPTIPQTFNISKQLKEIIFHYQWLLNERSIMVSYTLPEVIYEGNEALLYNVWENLFTNAIKYNKEGGTIDVKILENKKEINVQFQDSGRGLSEEEQQRIFERFYRIDRARSKNVEGTGLGLAIASAIVDLHKGFISIKSDRKKGSTFTVHLPKL